MYMCTLPSEWPACLQLRREPKKVSVLQDDRMITFTHHSHCVKKSSNKTCQTNAIAALFCPLKMRASAVQKWGIKTLQRIPKSTGTLTHVSRTERAALLKIFKF